jgi:hypothetical protein
MEQLTRKTPVTKNKLDLPLADLILTGASSTFHCVHYWATCALVGSMLRGRDKQYTNGADDE